METTFENARVGDRVYSPIYACKNIGDKTNAVIEKITKYSDDYPIKISPDIYDAGNIYSKSFTITGNYYLGGGQCLFWENPIKEIPTRPKRMVLEKGFMGIFPTNQYDNAIKLTTNIYATREEAQSVTTKHGKVVPIEFPVEE